jgi:hypothetical protein
MNALLDAYNLVTAEGNPMGFKSDYVFKFFIPDTMPDETPKEDVSVLVLVTEIQSTPGDYASNRSLSVGAQIQIQVWFDYTDPLIEQYEDLLRDYMESNGFYMYYSHPDKDPDIDKLFLTTKFSNTKFN